MADQSRFWIDQLFEKHECFPYGETRPFPVTVEEQSLVVLVPDYLPAMEVKIAMIKGDLLVVLGVTENKYNERPIGFMLVARRNENTDFTVVVWHETFPHATEILGLAEKT